MKTLVTATLWLVCLTACSVTIAQPSQDSAHLSMSTNKQISYLNHLRISKIKSRKSFTITQGQSVRIYCFNERNGKMAIRPAVVTDIRNHQISFLPSNDKFKEVTMTDSTLTYIEITTLGSAVRGILVNALLVSTIIIVVAVVVVDIFVSIFTGGSPMTLGLGSGSGLINLPWDDFHKHIRVKNHKGMRRWRVEVVGQL